MVKMNIIYVPFVLLAFSSTALSQDIRGIENHIGLSLGGSSLYLTDEYISPNDYSGNSWLYQLGWGSSTTNRTIQINIQFKDAVNLSNDLSEASNKIFLFNYRHHFPVHTARVFDKPLQLFFGPGMSLFMSNRTQKTIPMESSFGFASMDFNSRANIDFTDRIRISSGLNVSMLSFANKSGSQSGSNDFNILSPFGLQNLNFDFSSRYHFTPFFYAEAGYHFNIVRSKNWDYYRMMEDLVSLQLGIRF